MGWGLDWIGRDGGTEVRAHVATARALPLPLVLGLAVLLKASAMMSVLGWMATSRRLARRRRTPDAGQDVATATGMYRLWMRKRVSVGQGQREVNAA